MWVRRGRAASQDELFDWWSRLRLVVVDRKSVGGSNDGQARVRLDVVPFSRSEERDAREWFAESVSSAELARNEGISSSVDGSERGEGGVFSVLIATSIRQRPLTSFRWTLDLPPERSP